MEPTTDLPATDLSATDRSATDHSAEGNESRGRVASPAVSDKTLKDQEDDDESVVDGESAQPSAKGSPFPRNHPGGHPVEDSSKRQRLEIDMPEISPSAKTSLPSQPVSQFHAVLASANTSTSNVLNMLSGDAVEAAQPVQPVQPAQPVKPDQPAKPDQPGLPASLLYQFPEEKDKKRILARFAQDISPGSQPQTPRVATKNSWMLDVREWSETCGGYFCGALPAPFLHACLVPSCL